MAIVTASTIALSLSQDAELLATFLPALVSCSRVHCDTISTGLHLQQYCAAQNLFLRLRSGAIARRVEITSYASLTDCQADCSNVFVRDHDLGGVYGRQFHH
jgi:hypothetical protein